MTNFRKSFLRLIPLFLLTVFLCACRTSADPNEDLKQEYSKWQKTLDEKWSIFNKVETDSDWFSVYELPSDVYAFLEMPYEQDVCSFLILGKEKALLLDTGLGIEKIRPLVEELTDLPIIVVNSHDHFDHIGGNAEFDEVWCYDIDTAVQHLSNGPTEEEMEEFSVGMAEFLIGMGLSDIIVPDHIPGKAPTGTVTDGQLIDLGGRTLEVIYTPGHNTSSIMLFDAENRMLFTGDTYYPGPLYILSDDSSFSDYVISVRKAATLAVSENVEWVIGSHNFIEKGPEHLCRLADFLESIQRGEISDYEMVDDVLIYKMDSDISVMLQKKSLDLKNPSPLNKS